MNPTNRDVLTHVFGELAVTALEVNGPYILRDEVNQARINGNGYCGLGEMADKAGLRGVLSCPTHTAVVNAALNQRLIREDWIVDLNRVLADITTANDGGRFRDRDSIRVYLDSPVEISTKLRERIGARD